MSHQTPRLPDTVSKEPPLKQTVTFEAGLGRRIRKSAFDKDLSIQDWLRAAAELKLASEH